MLLGAFLVFAARCVTPEDAYREVEWRVVILIACMLGLGAAMDATGAASYLAAQVVGLVRGLSLSPSTSLKAASRVQSLSTSIRPAVPSMHVPVPSFR